MLRKSCRHYYVAFEPGRFWHAGHREWRDGGYYRAHCRLYGRAEGGCGAEDLCTSDCEGYEEDYEASCMSQESPDDDQDTTCEGTQDDGLDTTCGQCGRRVSSHWLDCPYCNPDS